MPPPHASTMIRLPRQPGYPNKRADLFQLIRYCESHTPAYLPTGARSAMSRRVETCQLWTILPRIIPYVPLNQIEGQRFLIIGA